jgi:Zn-dependent M28 family amino/carboxypeptidase
VPLARVFALADSGRMQSFAQPSTVHARIAMRTERVASPNVVARLAGSDPKLARELVIVSAHLDHLGIGVPVNGDSINNGAFDNGSGIACMLEAARAIVSAHARPQRSLLFLAVTGEEKGLQGSDYFAERPTVTDPIVADVNLDMFLMTHPFKKITAFGAEHSSLGAAVDRAARETGVRVVPDQHPEEVVFVRSDQFSFVRQDVPSVFPVNGGGTAAEDSIDTNWERTRYHSPSDDLAQPIDWESGAGFTRFAVRLMLDVANAPSRPAWNAGDYFGTRFAKK